MPQNPWPGTNWAAQSSLACHHSKQKPGAWPGPALALAWPGPGLRPSFWPLAVAQALSPELLALGLTGFGSNSCSWFQPGHWLLAWTMVLALASGPDPGPALGPKREREIWTLDGVRVDYSGGNRCFKCKLLLSLGATTLDSMNLRVCLILPGRSGRLHEQYGS